MSWLGSLFGTKPAATNKNIKKEGVLGENHIAVNIKPENGSGAVTVGGLKAAQLQPTPHPSIPSTAAPSGTTQGGGRRKTKGKGKKGKGRKTGKSKGKGKKRSTKKRSTRK
jgi:hypothetical protein